MVYRSELNMVETNNYTILDKDSLIRLLLYYKKCYDYGTDVGEELIIEDEYVNYGDVNPLEYGGIWVRQLDKNEFEILKNDPEERVFYDLLVDISDSWIDKKGVMSYIGMTNATFDPIQFAIGCTDFYSCSNFSRTERLYFNKDDLIEILKSRGIKIDDK